MRAKEFTDEQLQFIVEEKQTGTTWNQLVKKFKDKFKVDKSYNAIRNIFRREEEKSKPDFVVNKKRVSKVLILDIETLPLEAFVWGIFDQNIALNQIKQDWSVLSWAAKWLGDSPKKVMYMDVRGQKDIRDDKKILAGMWKLLDEADCVITQNGIKFDAKKLNARFIQQGFSAPSSYKHIDVLRVTKKHFGFTSHKLEHMTDILCTKYKKLKHNEFSGFSLWSECMKGNLKAFKSMEKYNKYDVLSLEELYLKVAPWGVGAVNLSVINGTPDACNACGSTDGKNKAGFHYTQVGKYQKYKCKVCGHETRDGVNLLEDTKSIKRNTR